MSEEHFQCGEKREQPRATTRQPQRQIQLSRVPVPMAEELSAGGADNCGQEVEGERERDKGGEEKMPAALVSVATQPSQRFPWVEGWCGCKRTTAAHQRCMTRDRVEVASGAPVECVPLATSSQTTLPVPGVRRGTRDSRMHGSMTRSGK